jgi:hypothetical protein
VTGVAVEQARNDVRGVTVARFEEVGVHIQGRGRVGVAEPTADRPHGNTRGQKLSRVEMPKVVQPDS